MTKLFKNLFKRHPDPKIPLKAVKVLEKDMSCYIVISCGTVKANGEMEVEMTYEGDQVLAVYLLGNAKDILEKQFESF